MNRLFPLLALWISFSASAEAQQSKNSWGLADNLNLYPFEKMNAFLSAPDIKKSTADIEIRLYTSGSPSGLTSLTSLVYSDHQWNATYHSRKRRTVDDPADATFPIKINQIAGKKLDSVFVGLVSHNVFTLPDQSQTSKPNVMIPYTILVKSNQQVRCYRFQDTWMIDDSYSEEFKEYKSIVELFSYVNDNFPLKM